MRDRTTFIGGTDISALFGQNPWKTAFAVWHEKTGQAEPIPDNTSMEWGRLLEPVIAAKFVAQHPEFALYTQCQELTHPQHPMIGGTVDAWLIEAKNATDMQYLKAGLEIKTAQSDARWVDDEPPAHYWMQCQWYCGIARAMGCDVDTWHVAVLFHGNDYREYTIPFDEVFFNDAMTYAVGWWDKHVIGGEPVEIDGSEAARQYQTERFKDGRTNTMIVADTLPTTDQEVINAYLALKKKMVTDELDLAVLEAQVMQIVGTNRGITHPSGVKITWVRSEPSISTAWAEVAKELNASEALIQKHSKVRKGRSYLKPSGTTEE